MGKVFEDEFMEIQSGLISLCLEVVEKVGQRVSKVYAYCSNEAKSKMFNAFFDVNGEIKTLNQLGVAADLAFQFLKLGTQDLEELDNICAKYNMARPTEIKMCYDVETGEFEAQCKYEEVCTPNTGVAGAQVFMEWLSEIKGEKGTAEPKKSSRLIDFFRKKNDIK